MRNNKLIGDLIGVVRILSKIQTYCEDVDSFRDGIGLVVRGKGNLLSHLESVYYSLLLISLERNDKLKDILGSMHPWIRHLKQSYLDKPRHSSKKPHTLTKKDAEKLTANINEWLIAIRNKFSEPDTILLKEYEFERFLSVRLRKGLGRKILSDLREGFELIGFNSPTAASMILLRASEGIVENYYHQVTGKSTKMDWNDLVDDLERNYKLRKPLSGYLHYLREKRNQAMHPGKKFSQEESERILISVKNLLEII